MKITAVRLRRLHGTLETDGPLWEERLVRPIDIYADYRARDDFEGGVQTDATHFSIESCFVQIETEIGVHGIAGPVPEAVAAIIAGKLSPMLLDRDPIAHDMLYMLWDQMHRMLVHGRQGDAMLAISAVDCALWDLKGRWLNVPVLQLLGGPTRASIPAYASMLGFAVLDPGRVRARAQEYQAKGYRNGEIFPNGLPGGDGSGFRKDRNRNGSVRLTTASERRHHLLAEAPHGSKVLLVAHVAEPSLAQQMPDAHVPQLRDLLAHAGR
jgi:L-rhamnonate dehydratase